MDVSSSLTRMLAQLRARKITRIQRTGGPVSGARPAAFSPRNRAFGTDDGKQSEQLPPRSRRFTGLSTASRLGDCAARWRCAMVRALAPFGPRSGERKRGYARSSGAGMSPKRGTAGRPPGRGTAAGLLSSGDVPEESRAAATGARQITRGRPGQSAGWTPCARHALSARSALFWGPPGVRRQLPSASLALA